MAEPSDAQEARIARFSARVSDECVTTSLGCWKTVPGCRSAWKSNTLSVAVVGRMFSSTRRAARVGTRLVQRTARRLTSTAAGRRLASCARQLLADYEQATRTGKEEQDAPLDGVLRVTAPSLFGRWHIAPLVWSILDLHPRVRAELVLTNRNLDLVEEGLDIAIRIGPLTESGLVARHVGRVRWALFASPDYVARRGRPRTPRDLIKHDIVYESRRPSPRE
jgi:DNA-binding transcriptional LysR family regulator